MFLLSNLQRDADPLRLRSYEPGHTDGGRRDVVLKPKGSGAKTLKDVGGWAFQLLCSRGENMLAPLLWVRAPQTTSASSQLC